MADRMKNLDMNKSQDSCLSKVKYRTITTYDFSKLLKPGEVMLPPAKAVSIEDQMRAIDPSFFAPMKGFCSPPRAVQRPEMTLRLPVPMLVFVRQWSQTIVRPEVRPPSEIHKQSLVARLLGGGRNNKRGKGRKTDVERYLDTMMGGRKAIKISASYFIPRAIGQDRCPPWQDLMRILTDLFYTGFILDETIQDHEEELCEREGGKGNVAIILDLFSTIEQLLQALDPEAPGLNTIISPMISATPPRSLVRYLFRAEGRYLNKYFVSDICSGDVCTQARSHSPKCTCVIKIRGIGPFFGFGAEFAFNNLPSRVAFMYDLDTKFARKKDKIYAKGVRHGFAFSQPNLFDI